MAKQDDPIKSQYRILLDLNKRLKNICDIYYISIYGTICMHSLVPFIEKFAVLKNSSDIDLYKGIIYLPNKLFEFSRDSKISKFTAIDTLNSRILGQIEGDLSIKLDKLHIPDNKISPIEMENEILSKNIYPSMYRKIPLILTEINKYSFIDLPDDYAKDIANNKVIDFIDTDHGLLLSFSKNIFPCISENDHLSYTILPLMDESIKTKKYVLYKKETDNMIIYTLCAYLCI